MRIPLPTSVKARLVRVTTGLVERFGYELVRTADPPLPGDFDDDAKRLYERVKPFTLTGPERVLALRDALRYVCAAGIPGAIVECGVWHGGSMLAAALTLVDLGATDRELYLFDTFSYVPDPAERDRDVYGNRAADIMAGAKADPSLTYPTVDQVRQLITDTGYPPERVHLVQGLVEDTVPAAAPDQIALLRLDTDWYAPTRHEMLHLYPRVPGGGVLIIDDYGQFVGAREAVDEYFAEHNETVLLHRIDFPGRTVVRPLRADVAARPGPSA